jgi:hypothetical protein
MIAFIKRLYRAPSAAEMLQRQLDDAKRERTVISMERERYAHTEKMLVERIKRIEMELKEMV